MTFFFLLLLMIGTLLPSDGAQGLFNPKSIAFILMGGAWGVNIIQKKKFSDRDQGLILAALFIASAILFFGFIGIENGHLSLGQAKLFIITASIPLGLLYLTENKQLNFSTFAKTVIYTNFLYSVVKIGLVLLHFMDVINLLHVMNMAGLRYMSMEVLGSLGRMQTSVDVLTPFILYFILSAKDWNIDISKKVVSCLTVVAWLSIALSFSRFFIFCGLFAHLMVWITKKQVPLSLSMAKALVIGGLIIATAGPERVYKVVEKRFFSEDSSRSDAVRRDQIEAMIESFEEAPLLGKGMGGYADKLIRDKSLKYSYEVQWVAFLMQFGIIGIFLISTLLLYLAYLLLSIPMPYTRLGIFGMYVLWLLAGFTNPFLISLPSGIIYAFFLGAATTKNG